MSDEELGYIGDVRYEVWRAGGNPDVVDSERVRETMDEGLYYEQSAARELRRQRPRDEGDGE